MERLPDDAVYEIMRNLSGRDLVNVSETNRQLRRGVERSARELSQGGEGIAYARSLAETGQLYALDDFFRRTFNNLPQGNAFLREMFQEVITGTVTKGQEATALYLIQSPWFRSVINGHQGGNTLIWFLEEAIINGNPRIFRKLLPLGLKYNVFDSWVNELTGSYLNLEIYRMLYEANIIKLDDVVNNFSIFLEPIAWSDNLIKQEQKIFEVFLDMNHPIVWPFLSPWLPSEQDYKKTRKIIRRAFLDVIYRHQRFWENMEDIIEYAMENFADDPAFLTDIASLGPTVMKTIREVYDRLSKTVNLDPYIRVVFQIYT